MKLMKVKHICAATENIREQDNITSSPLFGSFFFISVHEFMIQ